MKLLKSNVLFTFIIVIVISFLQFASCQNEFRVNVPELSPDTDDDDNDVCIVRPLEDLLDNLQAPIYITKIRVGGDDAQTFDRILLHTCVDVDIVNNNTSTENAWDCSSSDSCEGESLFVWANESTSTEMASDVIVRIDPIQTPYLIIQIHFVNRTIGPDSSDIVIEYQYES
jgi:hypothetical protein